ncbi:hypothetical protein X943_003784 [Babesia divergens]|uniref:CCAAT-binding factor domain-containing protein n=1 Tax=Babesia divergens TaxID=32595 RepID=A0AAD9LKJ0_BABDI|nr:hypothetical protein X943_003784 [Babesia divergens]
MPAHSGDETLQIPFETCYEVVESLKKVAKPEDILQKVDYLIEQIFLAKADLGCTFDRQFFIDASKVKYDGIAPQGSHQNQGKRLRRLCVAFLRTIAALTHKESYQRHIIPKILTVIRLEASLLSIANTATENKGNSTSFPVPILEFLIGLLLYAEVYDEELVDSLLSGHILISEEWIYHSFIALEHIKNDFESSQRNLYKDDNIPETIFFRRFVSLLLKMPQPQATRQRVKISVHRRDSEVKMDNMSGEDDNEDLDSDSDLEYSDQLTDEDMDDTEESETEGEMEQPDERSKKTYNYINVYSALWQGTIFGRLPLSDDKAHDVLNHMPDHILPYASNPAIYANWLIRHLNGKDKILSMLSLKSIFELILRYGLGEIEGLRTNKNEEQPISAFYERLYGHLNDDIIGSKYGNEFLVLLNTALKSTMLPSQLIASFIKKLVRTACFTRCLESTTLLTIALNMLRKHNHTCLTMVHEGNLNDATGTPDLFNVDKIAGGKEKDVQVDNVKDMHLWELPLLMNHFNERTARIASTFYSDLKKKRCVILKAEDIMGCDAREHLRQELARARREDTNTFRKAPQKTTELTTQLFV